MDSITTLINQALTPKEERVRSGKFSPSSLGKCYRAQVEFDKEETEMAGHYGE